MSTGSNNPFSLKVPSTAPAVPGGLLPCKYKTGRTLGAGAYSIVKEATNIETNEKFAAKVINKKMMEKREYMVKNEIMILKKVSNGHPNILRLYDYFETVHNLYLITELATGGELFDRICQKGSFYETDAAELVRTITSAVKYLHDNNIVHRDLKPENLLYRSKDEDSNLLIADFGLSKIFDVEQYSVLMTTCGTPEYMAPEVFRRSGYGKPVDIWAIGVITYFMLCGYTPFSRNSSVQVMNAILTNDFTFHEKYWDHVSETAKDFIRQCLNDDPSKRPTAEQALEHPFLKKAVTKPAVPAPETTPATPPKDLLPGVRENFNARKRLRKAINVVRAMNTFRDL
ncbi:CAMK/CAMK1 protein kinase Cmk1 [Schizosaccharomyces japonicus yFS275]|uniref:CAMK/CAMK1 protein kinase Cmk1 n=1 Tax=Schizosaccharomyces japonicus (strain yFS275 / FY16936) TaxID=402676 RepID=B6K1D3_SCHJY|nr:CAMK/CAMK1 protein kinase Cmk1 [Schizosaccharomyces japonicus yFS275]EEB07754.1 CAMK/CAMK1 protein kinase Cmk1 [Schizosaccharomyces japonicus yFS275]